jgi:hypothetical protein
MSATIKLIGGQDAIAIAIERLEALGSSRHFVGADLMILVGIECSDQWMRTARTFRGAILEPPGATPFTSWSFSIAGSFPIPRSLTPWWLIFGGPSLRWLGQNDP